MSAHHDSHDGHAHANGAMAYGRMFAVGVSMNLLFVIIEWGFGMYANSLSLVADAVHNLGDVLGLVLAWAASLLIVFSTWQMFTQSLAMALQAVPTHIDILEVKEYLGSLEGVAQVHDIHIWAISTTDTAMTAHLVMPNGHPGDTFLQTTTEAIAHRYGIHHCTLQIEVSNSPMHCRLASDHVI